MKIPSKEFFSNCTACGNNWTMMLYSGVEHYCKKDEKFKELKNSLSENFTFKEIFEKLETLVSFD